MNDGYARIVIPDNVEKNLIKLTQLFNKYQFSDDAADEAMTSSIWNGGQRLDVGKLNEIYRRNKLISLVVDYDESHIIVPYKMWWVKHNSIFGKYHSALFLFTDDMKEFLSIMQLISISSELYLTPTQCKVLGAAIRTYEYLEDKDL